MHSNKKKPKQGGQKLIVRLMALLLVLMFVVSLGSQILIYAHADDLGGAGEEKVRSAELLQRRSELQKELDSLNGEAHTALRRYELLGQLSEVISTQIEIDTQLLNGLNDECKWLSKALDEVVTAANDEEVVLECGQQELVEREESLRSQQTDKLFQRDAVKARLEEERILLSDTECAAQAATEELQKSEEYQGIVRSLALRESGEDEDILTEETSSAMRASYTSSESAADSEDQSNSTALTSSQDGRQVVAYALNFVGKPYRWGGDSLTEGCDCSGFIKAVFRNFGMELPHFSGSLQHVGEAVDYEDAQPGDLICYDGHVGIYMGNDKMVNAFDSKHGIIICSVNISRLVTVRRLI